MNALIKDKLTLMCTHHKVFLVDVGKKSPREICIL